MGNYRALREEIPCSRKRRAGREEGWRNIAILLLVFPGMEAAGGNLRRASLEGHAFFPYCRGRGEGRGDYILERVGAETEIDGVGGLGGPGGVVAVTAVDDVLSLPPVQGIVPAAAMDNVVAFAAVDKVISVGPDDDVVALSPVHIVPGIVADDRVITVAAPYGHAVCIGAPDDVIALAAQDDDIVHAILAIFKDHYIVSFFQIDQEIHGFFPGNESYLAVYGNDGVGFGVLRDVDAVVVIGAGDPGIADLVFLALHGGPARWQGGKRI